MLARASWLQGFIEADPTVVAVVVGAVAASAIAYTVLRLVRRDRGRPGRGPR